MFRGHVITAVWKRNVAGYFSGVLGYLFIAVFVVAASVLAFDEKFFVENQCNLDQLSESFPWLLLFIIPAVTMTIWAEEKKLGTDELLFTLPATDAEILTGKYLAAVTVYTVALLFSATLTGVLAYLGDPDWQRVISTYFGYWIAGGALLAAGMFGSVLTSSATVAFILGVLFSAVPIALDWTGLGRMLGNFGIREPLSVPGNLKDITIGVIPLGSVVYFIALAAFFLYLNAVMIARRHWGGQKDSGMGWQYAVRTISLGVVALCATYVFAVWGGRIDMTSERLYTLSPVTRGVIKQIDPERPVMLQAYVSPRVPEDFVAVRKNLLALLRQYQGIGGKRIDLRIVDTTPFSKEAEEATAGGVQRREVESERNGRYIRDDIYLGVAVSSGYDRVVIPYLEKGTPIEYELTRAIGTVSKEKRPTVGILTTDAKVMGGMDMSSFRQTPEWRLVRELKKQYVVKEISPDEEIKDDACDVLIAVLPSSLTQPQMENLVSFVKRGRPTLLFDDPIPYFIDPSLQLVPSSPNKPSTGGGMMGMGAQPGGPKADGGRALSLLDALGIDWDVESILYDFASPHPQYTERFPRELVFVTKPEGKSTNDETSGLSQDSVITRGLQEVIVWFGGGIEKRSGSKLEFTPLLRSHRGTSGIISFNEVAKSSGFPFGGGRSLDFEAAQKKKPDKQEHIIAAAIKSPEAKKDSGVNAIFVADADLVHDVMFDVWERELLDLKIDNVLFVLNCVDSLAGNEDYIALRNRRAEQKNLVRIDAEKAQFLGTTQSKVVEANAKAEEALADAKKRMNEELDKLRNDKSIDAGVRDARLRVVEERESRLLTLKEKEIKRDAEETVRQAKSELEQRIDTIENRVKFWAWIIPPIPAIVLGLIMLVRRINDERRGIVSERLVKR
jgi:ABC-2 type transport system permease protein